jgi:hypothetical protein
MCACYRPWKMNVGYNGTMLSYRHEGDARGVKIHDRTND